MFITINFVYLFVKKSLTEDLLAMHSLDGLKNYVWARLKSGAGNFVLASYMGSRDPSTWGIICCLPCTSTRSWIQSRAARTGYLPWDTSITAVAQPAAPQGQSMFYLFALLFFNLFQRQNNRNPETDLPSAHSLPKDTQQPGLAQTKSWSLEYNPGHPHEWQECHHLQHLEWEMKPELKPRHSNTECSCPKQYLNC